MNDPNQEDGMSKWTIEWTGFKPRTFWIRLGDKYYGYGKPKL